MDPALLVGIGGAAGSVFRFLLSKIPTRKGIPLGTLIVNVTGSLALAILVFSQSPADSRYFLGTGILGGYTTFSTFSYETFRMMENHDYYTMGANILTNAGGSLLGVLLGYWIVMG
ncbi:fluoride efflux transporter CrcB [Methanoregula sp. UBA64]|jgi:fluoride exporter|uniref:fluoride efflux transporter CrcB n=1 Tax=Methanoregula sp. UBA64 TaxID=1915554 RepID=UPI0025D6E2B1|nr:fluoride efflux transporter CrcB [Methanoregula sp. UBA64]